jgi:branched-subunit amino acid ABC-type transport system permease component
MRPLLLLGRKCNSRAIRVQGAQSNLTFVIAGHSRTKDGVASLAYDAAIHDEMHQEKTDMAFRVLIIGGTGQVGAAVVRALVAGPSCAEVVMVNRKAISLAADLRVRQVVLDTAAAN